MRLDPFWFAFAAEVLQISSEIEFVSFTTKVFSAEVESQEDLYHIWQCDNEVS